MSFVDPPSMPADQIGSALEAATDRYATCCDTAAVSENAYLKARSVAWVNAGDVAQTARRDHCENQPGVIDKKSQFNLDSAKERAAKAKVEELRHRLMAALSHQRFVRDQT